MPHASGPHACSLTCVSPARFFPTQCSFRLASSPLLSDGACSSSLLRFCPVGRFVSVKNCT